MTPDILLKKIDRLRICTKDGDRSPHKPLLLLLALARVSTNQPRLVLFEDTVSSLVRLLSLYGPRAAKDNPTDPFWRLANDGIWENPELLQLPLQNHYSQKFLTENKVRGGFTDDVYNMLKSNPDMVEKMASKLLATHFKPSQWESIRDDISLDTEPQSYYYIQKLARRDGKFREKVLSAYNYRCAICGFNLQLYDKHIALEAAHIRWFEASGPNTENNGLALCSTHHKLLDSGVIGISDDRKLVVSDAIECKGNSIELVNSLHQQELLPPTLPEYIPKLEHIRWQRKQVFKGSA